jgi:hypothetical protein
VTPETLFDVCNAAVLPFWLLLLIAPGWSWTQRLVHGVWVPALVGGAYAIAIVQGLAESPEGGSFSSLQGVMTLFTNPWAVCGGWLHYLVFDLFVGAWEARDARRLGIPHLWIVPCLLMTLMLGPIGLLLYVALRLVRTGATGLEEQPA